jgi:hypothetical protein
MTHTSPIVKFGTVTFTGADIKEMTLVEECSPLTLVLPVDVLELVLHSDNADFSMINPAGDYALLKSRQPLLVYENVGAAQVFIGQFFLDTWENLSDKQIQLNCMDLLGIIDTYTYNGGIWLTPITLDALLYSMFDPIGVSYQLDPDLANFPITGWIPLGSYRDALQQIAFAAGAYVTCSRQNGFIKIGKSALLSVLSKGINTGVASTGQTRVWQQRWRSGVWGGVLPDIVITKAQKGAKQSLTLKTQVTGVEVSTHDIVLGIGTKELYNGDLATGDPHKITFAQPMHSLFFGAHPAGSSITEYGANYAIIDAGAGGLTSLNGFVYEDTIKTCSVYTQGLGPTVKRNIVSITEASLVNTTNGMDVTQRVYDYYQQRYFQKVRLYAPQAAAANVVLVDTLYSKQIRGVVEKMTINLTGGFIADAEVVGSIEES